MVQLKIGAPESGQKILKFLLRKTDGSKVFLFKLFRKGAIRVNGKKVDQDYIISENDMIESNGLNENTNSHQFSNIQSEIDILYQDEDVIAVDKDYQTAVHQAPGIRCEDTLLEKLKGYLFRRQEPYESVFPVHRIDRNTGGVVLFAKNYQTAKSLARAFHDGKVLKIYQAVLEGKLEDVLFVSADILRDEEKNSVKVENLSTSRRVPDKTAWLSEFYENSKTISATVLRPLANNGRETLAEIEIWTGRHHQIRAVCGAAGYPVGGDRKYGSGGRGQRLLCKRMVLEEGGLSIESRRGLNEGQFNLKEI